MGAVYTQEKTTKSNPRRLKELKLEKYLSHRIFQRISENMHYEILKNLGNIDLLRIRETNLGGYQLTSNPLLRSRVENYFLYSNIIIEPEEDQKFSEQTVHNIETLFEQTGKEELVFTEGQMNDQKLVDFSKILRYIHELKGITISN